MAHAQSEDTPMTVYVEFRTRDERGPAGIVRQATGEAQSFTGWLDLMSRLEAITETQPPSTDPASLH